MEQIKKYIRGNAKRGHEVITELEKLGGKNILNFQGTRDGGIYHISSRAYPVPNTIHVVSEDSFTGQLLLTHPDYEEIELPKYKYPKTYKECCEVLGIDARDLDILNNMLDTSEMVYCKNLDRLLNSFRKLLICRDAYWKIAGEEMGLGKSWKPDWEDDNAKYSIFSIKGIPINATSCYDNAILAFPSEEMRDAFKENFDKDLEICKELL